MSMFTTIVDIEAVVDPFLNLMTLPYMKFKSYAWH